MSQPALDGAVDGQAHGAHPGFLVLWQDPVSRAYRVVGTLGRVDGNYVFRYTGAVDGQPPAPLLPGFPDAHRSYESPDLFATFANRVMTPRRDSYRHHLRMLGIDAASPDPFEVLARTWGSRATDLIQLLPIPRVDDAGRLTTRFLVHGGSHVDPAGEHLRTVHSGERLGLQAEPGNPQDPSAVLVLALANGGRLGYVPRPLAPFIHRLWDAGAVVRVVAEHVNLPGERLASNQMRLLARLQTQVPAGFDVLAALRLEG